MQTDSNDSERTNNGTNSFVIFISLEKKKKTPISIFEKQMDLVYSYHFKHSIDKK